MNIQQTIKSTLAMIKTWAFTAILAILFIGCASDTSSRLSPPKTAFGSANEICVIADQEVWESAVGDSIRYLFGAAYPILPQPEPTFDLRHFTPSELEADAYRKELRSYLVVANMADVESPTFQSLSKDLGEENMRKAREQSDFNIKVGYDKWAKNQIIVYLFAQNQTELIEAMQRSYPAIANKFNEADKEQFDATVYFGGENRAIGSQIETKFGLNIKIPSDYFIAVDDPETMWIRKETEVLSSNILLHKIPYNNEQQLSKANIKAVRDTLGKRYVSTTIENTYMRTNDVDLPMVTRQLDLNGAYAIEARGIWDIVNDYMGGPFLSYMILNETKNELIYIDCFVHAPAKKKRDFVMQLEHIVSSVKFL